MGFLDSVSSLVSSAVNVISNAVGSLGGTLASSASSFLSVVAPYLGVVSQIIGLISNFLGVKKEDESVEEIGAKAMMSDKKPEDFNSNEEYINHLRNDIKLDKEKFEKAGEVEKIARTVVGATVLVRGIEEKKGFEIPNETWITMAKLGLENKSSKETNTILDTFKDGNLGDLTKFVDGKLGAKAEGEVGDKLVEMYQKLEPNSSIEDIEKKVMHMSNV